MTVPRTILSSIILALLMLCTTAASSQAAQVVISLLPNAEQIITGYKIHYGTISRNYTSVTDVGLPEVIDGTLQAKIDGLQEGQVYYFAASAYNDIAESDYSTEIAYAVPSTAESIPPVASYSVTLQGNENTTLSGQLNADNPDNTPLQFTITTQPEHGTLTVGKTTGSFVYTSIPGFTGMDEFIYTAANSAGIYNNAKVRLTILAGNDSPVATNSTFSLNQGHVYKGQLTADDADGDTLHFFITTAPKKGRVSISDNGAFTYTPNADATGSDSFTFKANNGYLESNSAIVDIIIQEIVTESESNENFAFEVGELSVTSAWQSVTFESTFIHPAVVAKAGTMNDAEPSTIRIRNLTSTGFEIRIQEWDYLDDVHPEETIVFMAMEQGYQQIADNVHALAGCSDISGLNNYHRINFSSALPTQPVVLTSVVTNNEPDAVTLRARGITPNGFFLAMQEQEKNNRYHTRETTCFIAMEEWAGTVDNLMVEVATTDKTLTHTPTPILFSQNFIDTPFFLADMQSANGSDTAVLGIDGLSGTEAHMVVVEEKSRDKEVNHTSEIGGYVAIMPSPL